ncbi:Mu transposase C-terminal domain-containing protein [Photobacterium leiognathi]|uniref:Mu transposase C-terminal domain-containing protein n=1 Tax=Photobacterium leiognathi TaxID=553611 RepID=UPI0029825FC7|nr:Mu transposase C-terminal domain-containing protein [Photobacterium leiognathi]
MKNYDKPSLFSDEFEFENQIEEIELASNVEDDVSRDLASYPDATQKEVMRRYYFIEWMRKELVGGWTQKNLDPLLNRAARELKLKAPKWRALANWWKIYSQSGFKLTSLIPRQTAGNRNLKVKNEMVFFDKALERYLVPERPSIAAVYQYYSDLIRIENQNIVENKIEALSYKGFYNRIKKLPAYDVKVARHGKYLADMEFNSIDAHYPASRVLEKVEIDHTPLDLILLDDEHNFPIGRPYLTLLIDQFSRCIIGFYLGFKEPSYFSVMKALLNAIKPKNYILEQFPNIEKEWCCEGKMESLVVDNGAEFWSKSLEQSCLELGIHIQYNPVRKPWLKPLVERIFRTINSKLTISIPGKTFSNILQREDYDSKKDAVMRFSIFNEILHKWIIDVYHHEPDSRKRSIPYLKWQEGINYLPPISYSPEDEKQLAIILGIKAKRQHRRGGIHIHSLRYDSEILADCRRMYPSVTSVLTKTNPDDISYIYVFIEHEQKYIKVPCVDPIGYTKGLSLFQHQINLKLQREYIDKKTDLDSLAKVRMYINDRILKEINDLKSRQKKATKGISRLAKHASIGSDKKESISTSPLLNVSKDADQTKPVQPKGDDWDDLISDLDPY